jgi:hypothetical protein
VKDIDAINQLADEAMERARKKCTLVTTCSRSYIGVTKYKTAVIYNDQNIYETISFDMLFCVQQADKYAKMILRGAALANMGVR